LIETEIPLVFENEGQRIVGMLHRPAAGRLPGVVLYHGLTGSRTEAHWLFVKISRRLAQRGIMSLRFDFRGSGESGGRFEDMTLSGEISDGLRAFEYLVGECGADPERTGTLGLSMGGAVAAAVAGRLGARVGACALLNPVARPFEDLSFVAQTRKVDTSAFPIDFNAFRFGKSFFDDLPRIRPLEEIAAARCPVLLVSGTADATVSPARSLEYDDTLRARGTPVELFLVEGADHTFASARWERTVVDKVADWFVRTIG
jgi:uncharacterized protein